MAVADKIGHDKRGNPVYRRHPDGSDLVVLKQERVIEVVGGKEVVREVETPELVVDDQTPYIAAEYREWLTSLSW